MRDAVKGWVRRPVLGYGVTGFRFLDTQYFRTLVETGIVGFAAFLWLIVSVLRSTGDSLVLLREPNERGLVIGFLAGTVGLLVHSFGSNTFIIIRIMEPFWFFMAIVVALPMLERRQVIEPVRAPVPAYRYST
jgi:O-antigen ligase